MIFLIEQEMASVMRFVLETLENPYPYYEEIPEGFLVPAVYFPVPEIETDNDTLSAYKLTYVWNISFIHRGTREAHDMALKVMEGLKKNRNKVKIINEDGSETEKSFYVKTSRIAETESGTVQMTVEWESRRLYTMEAVLKMRRYYVNSYIKK